MIFVSNTVETRIMYLRVDIQNKVSFEHMYVETQKVNLKIHLSI